MNEQNIYMEEVAEALRRNVDVKATACTKRREEKKRVQNMRGCLQSRNRWQR